MRSYCATGGRLLHWLGYWSPYAYNHKPEDFVHIGMNTTLSVDAWRPKQPNGKEPGECLVAYLGLEYDKSW